MEFLASLLSVVIVVSSLIAYITCLYSKKVPIEIKVALIAIPLLVAFYIHMKNRSYIYDFCYQVEYEIHKPTDRVECKEVLSSTMFIIYDGQITGLSDAGNAEIRRSDGSVYKGEVLGGREHGDGEERSKNGNWIKVKYEFGERII